MAVTPSRRLEAAEHSVATLIAPIVAHVIACPGHTMAEIGEAFPQVRLRTLYRVISAAIRMKLLRKETRILDKRRTCVFPSKARNGSVPVPTATKDGHVPSVWIHPIRAKALGLPVATRAAEAAS